MQGCIQKRGKKYYVVLAINGSRKWYKGGATKRAAQKVLNDKIAEINSGTYKEMPKTTFKTFANHWLKTYAEVNVKPSTLTRYKDILERLLIPALWFYQMSDISAGQLQLYISERLKKVSARTVVQELTVIKLMFKHALKWGYIKLNPAEILDRPKFEKPEIEILTPDEIEKFLATISGHYRVAFLTTVLTGLRAGEIWGLRWEDINWNAKQIHIKRALWNGTFQTPKSKRSVRKIDVPASLISELKKWKLACPISTDGLVFPDKNGQPTPHGNAIRRHFIPALKKAGLQKVSFHSLRHTNASIRIQSGQNIKYIQSQLGHSSINVTMDTYGHLFNDVNFSRQQVELLEQSFGNINKVS
jgi:integrase